MTVNATPWREIVREQLQLLASADEQLEYEQRVPHVDVTRELVELWFSDTYHPGDAKFREQFTAEELRELESFDQTFRRNKPRLPESRGAIKHWLASEVWREVMHHAERALRGLRG